MTAWLLALEDRVEVKDLNSKKQEIERVHLWCKRHFGFSRWADEARKC